MAQDNGAVFAWTRRSAVTGLAATGALAFLGNASSAATGADVIAESTGGRVRGVRMPNAFHFRGIPYGGSTGGAHRFLPPTPAPKWTGIRDAVDYAQRSPQPSGPPGTMPGEKQAMGENCLVLNVWTPALDQRPRPVMVWLHPGGFNLGSGSDYTGQGTLSRKEDVVLVEVNHRLNIFGFLHLADYDQRYAQSGVVGILDIVAALEWVRENIAAFGGDPGNVTIFGESGGGAKVSTLLAMPAAKGLFHRAIAQSGFYIRGIEPADAAATTREVFSTLRLKDGDVTSLQAVPMDRLLGAFSTVSKAAGRQRRTFGPVVDGLALPRHPFDPDAPSISADVPFIAGVTRDESTILLGMLSPDPELMFALDEAGMKHKLAEFLQADAESVSKLVSSYRSRRPNASPSDIFFAVTSDSMMRRSSIIEAERKSALGRAPAWLYLFTWDKSLRFGGRMKAHHGIELGFVFDTIDDPDSKLGNGLGHRLLADQMRAAWASFARTGDPNHSGLPRWPAYDVVRRDTMVFDMPSHLESDPAAEDLRALNALELIKS